MGLTNWLKSLKQRSLFAKKAPRRQPRWGKQLSIEALEERVVMTTTVFLDFGLGLPGGQSDAMYAGRPIQSTTLPILREIAFDGQDTGPDLTNAPFSLDAGQFVWLNRLSVDFNGYNGQDEQ